MCWLRQWPASTRKVLVLRNLFLKFLKFSGSIFKHNFLIFGTKVWKILSFS